MGTAEATPPSPLASALIGQREHVTLDLPIHRGLGKGCGLCTFTLGPLCSGGRGGGRAGSPAEKMRKQGVWCRGWPSQAWMSPRQAGLAS